MDHTKQIFVNGRFLLRPMTGVERYAYRACCKMQQEGVAFTVVCPKNGEIQKNYNVENFNIVRYGIGSSHLWEQLVLPLFFIGRKDYVLYSFSGLGSILVKNKIMTIHDLSFLANPAWFSRSYYWFYRIMTPLAVRTSQGIITVSNFSKSEILKYYTFVDSSKIEVKGGSYDKTKFFIENYADGPQEEPFALAVASLDPRKNLSALVAAFSRIEGIKLKIVGSSYKSFAKEDGMEAGANIEYFGRADDKTLRRLYNTAAFYISSSLYEGFGLPLIEAKACGCKLVISDIPVYREVCGDDAVYFNPRSVDDIVNTVNGIMHSELK